LLAPHTATISVDGIASLFANYVTRTGGSLFPLTPYAGFFFFGVVAGALAFPQGTATPRGRSLVRLVLLAALLRVTAVWIARIEVPVDPQSDVAFALRKLAFVVAAFAVLVLASWKLKRLPRVLERLSGETLVLYVVHLQLLYPAGIGLVYWLGPTLPLPAAMGIALLLMLVSAAAALAWNAWRGRRRAMPRAPRESPD
jgi:surface polysaccharide O-acyltransferase-like enzyme